MSKAMKKYQALWRAARAAQWNTASVVLSDADGIRKVSLWKETPRGKLQVKR